MFILLIYVSHGKWWDVPNYSLSIFLKLFAKIIIARRQDSLLDVSVGVVHSYAPLLNRQTTPTFS